MKYLHSSTVNFISRLLFDVFAASFPSSFFVLFLRCCYLCDHFFTIEYEKRFRSFESHWGYLHCDDGVINAKQKNNNVCDQ